MVKHLSILLLTILFIVPICADPIVTVSTQGGANLGGNSVDDGDLVEFDGADVAGTAQVVFTAADFFDNNVDIDALHVLNNGNLVISTQGNAKIDGQTFDNGDVFVVDVNNGTANLLFDEDLFFDNSANVNGLFFDEGANRLFVTNNDNEKIGGVNVKNGDIVEIDVSDINNPTFVDFTFVEFDEDLGEFTTFQNEIKMDAFTFDDEGNLLISVQANENSLDGNTFDDDDIIQINDDFTTALFFDAGIFDNNEDIDALFVVVPEPSKYLLMLLGVLGLIVTQRRRKVAKK